MISKQEIDKTMKNQGNITIYLIGIIVLLALGALGLGIIPDSIITQEAVDEMSASSTVAETTESEELTEVQERAEVKIPEGIILSHVTTNRPIGADTGAVFLPPKTRSSRAPILTAFAAHGEIHRILAYLAKESSRNRNQVFYYDFATRETIQATHETEFIFDQIHVLDYPVSAILYYTKNDFKLLRLSDNSIITLSKLNKAAPNYFAVSPDSKHLAYFDDTSNLVIRDLSTPKINIVKTHPNPISSALKGADSASPLLYSKDGSMIYLLESITSQGASSASNQIVAFRPLSGAREGLLADNTLKQPLARPFDNDLLYYIDYGAGVLPSFNLNQFNPATKEKKSFAVNAGNLLYLKNKVYVDSSSYDGQRTNTFTVTSYDIPSGTGSTLLTIAGDTVTYENVFHRFVGFGINDQELILYGSRKNSDTGDIENGLYSYNLTSHTAKLLVVLTSPSPTTQIEGMSLEIIAPREGEQIPIGVPYTIKWRTTGLPSSAKMLIILKFEANQDKVLFLNTENDGSEVWNVPADAALGPRELRISSEVGVGEGGILAAQVPLFTLVSSLSPSDTGPAPIIDELTGPETARRWELATWTVKAHSVDGRTLDYWACYATASHPNFFGCGGAYDGVFNLAFGEDTLIYFYVTDNRGAVTRQTKQVRVTAP